MGLLSSMPSHVHHQHVLCLERFLVPGAVLPPTNERFFVRVNVIVVDVFDQLVLGVELQRAISPMAIGFNEISRLILGVRRVHLGTSEPTASVHHIVHRAQIQPRVATSHRGSGSIHVVMMVTVMKMVRRRCRSRGHTVGSVSHTLS